MIKRKIRQVLTQQDKDWHKQCNNKCKKCKYHLKDMSCYAVHLLNWLAENDEIIKMIKESENEK